MQNLDKQASKHIRVSSDEEIDKRVTRRNGFDEFIGLVSDKPNIDVIITAAFGYLLAGFVGIVARGIWKHVFKKGGPKHDTQQKRAAQITRKRKAKHGRAK